MHRSAQDAEPLRRRPFRHPTRAVVTHHESHLGRWLHASRRPAALARLVESIWYFDGRLTHRRERIYPDGRVELNVHLGAAYGAVTGRGTEPFPRVCVSGLLLRSAVIEAPPEATVVMGVRLFPAGAAALLGRPVHELTGWTVDLRDVMGSTADELLERCGAAHGPESRLDAAEAWLAERAERAQASGGVERAVGWAAQEIEHRRGALSVGRLRERTGWSRSRFAEAFRQTTGVSAKHLARIVRFRGALEHLNAGGLPLSEVALRAGYYDQAHFNAEFRAFADATPGEYLASLRYPGSVNVAQ